jgi:alkylated DNA repair dioxygenase AlkB
MPDGEVVLYSEVFRGAQHDRLFLTLLTDIHWQQHLITLYGRSVTVPRLSAWYGDADVVYSYSGLRLEPLPWITALREIKTVVEGLTVACFNSVLLNLYRDGQDSMGWHSDAEPELGHNPIIASVSLGAMRRFVLQHKKERLRIPLDLPAGSVLIMSGSTQHHWRHSLPKTRRSVGSRVNLTFRVTRRAAHQHHP